MQVLLQTRDEFLKHANSPYKLISEKEQPNQHTHTHTHTHKEDLNRHFPKEYTQKANRHMIRRSIWLIIRETQIKVTRRYRPSLKSVQIMSPGEDVEKKEPS